MPLKPFQLASEIVMRGVKISNDADHHRVRGRYMEEPIVVCFERAAFDRDGADHSQRSSDPSISRGQGGAVQHYVGPLRPGNAPASSRIV
jgi:hypothetical protein